jgi:hypothetical protein
MPSESQAQALQELLETNLPIVVLQTHDEKRVLTLAEAVARRTRRALWAWSACTDSSCAWWTRAPRAIRGPPTRWNCRPR